MEPEKLSTPSLALVGCGYWGKNLARNFNALGALHTICEPENDRHKELAGTYPGITTQSDLAPVLKDPAIRQLAIAAPAVQHYALAREALEAGKDVFVEKPFCLKADEGRDLQSIAEANGRTLMVGHLLQYHPVVCRIQELLAEGVFGKLLRISSRRLNLGKVRIEENAFWSLAPHDISVVLSLLGGSHPKSVHSIAETYLQEGISDCSSTSIEFINGVRAEIQVSWLHPFKEQKLCVIGDQGMAVFDDTKDWPEKLMVRQDYFGNGQLEPLPVTPEEPLQKECQHFLESCHAKTAPKTDAAEGIRVLEILEAAQASADSGGAAVSLA